jgi:hypothetical protein
MPSLLDQLGSNTHDPRLRDVPIGMNTSRTLLFHQLGHRDQKAVTHIHELKIAARKLAIHVGALPTFLSGVKRPVVIRRNIPGTGSPSRLDPILSPRLPLERRDSPVDLEGGSRSSFGRVT